MAKCICRFACTSAYAQLDSIQLTARTLINLCVTVHAGPDFLSYAKKKTKKKKKKKEKIIEIKIQQHISSRHISYILVFRDSTETSDLK